MRMVQYQSINYAYNDHSVLNGVDFAFEEGKNYFILGASSSGKTTLARLFSGELVPDKEIDLHLVESALLSTKKNTQSLIEYLFSSLDSMDLSIEEEKECVMRIITSFGLKQDLEKKICDFSFSFQIYLSLLAHLVTCKPFLVVDDLFLYLTSSQVSHVLSYCKSEGISLVYLGSTLEYATYFDYLYVLHDGKIAMEGEMLECLKEEKVLTRLGFQLPFMVDLSIQLGYYGLLEEIIVDPGKMIGAIWK